VQLAGSSRQQSRSASPGSTPLLDLRVPEFIRYRQHLVPGSIVGFHDTGPQFGAFGPMIATIPGLQPINLRTPRGVTFAQVQ
jgi:hypothetical protein